MLAYNIAFSKLSSLNVIRYSIQYIVISCSLTISLGALSYQWNTTGNTVLDQSTLSSPQGLFIKSNIIYISDAASDPVVYQMATSASAATFYINSSSMAAPQSIYIDSSNNAYVPDFDNSCVLKFPLGSSTGVIIIAGISGSPGSDVGSLDGPSALAFDSTETYMYVADSNNNRIIRHLASATSATNGVVVAVSETLVRLFLV